MSGTVQGIDGQRGTDGTDGLNATSGDGTNGTDGGAGTAGQNVTYDVASDQAGTYVATGGNGGGGGNGGNGGSSTGVGNPPGTGFYLFGSGGNGGNAGNGGAGGAASVTIQPSLDGLTDISAQATGGNGGSENQTLTGAAGSTAQHESGYDYDGSSYVQDSGTTTGVGGMGAAGSSAGDGADATVAFDGQTGLVGSATILLSAAGGIAGDGGAGSDGGSGGDMNAAAGGAGGAGGNGGNAATEMRNWNVTAQAGAGLSITLDSAAANGGMGAAGGRGGFAEHRVDMSNGPDDSHTATDTFGDGGDGGRGGDAGQAVDRFDDNTIVGAATVQLNFMAGLGTPGQGGAGGVSLPPGTPPDSDITHVGHTPGLDGLGGNASAAILDISGNTIAVTGELDLAIQTAVPITGPLVSFTFVNNNFDGGGSGTLVISPGGGTAGFASVFDVRDQTLSIAGSPTNVMTGFSTFTNDSLGSVFIDGAGSQTYNVTASSPGAPDEVFFQPGHGQDVVNSSSLSNLLVDLAGFGPALNNFAEVMADATDDGQGNTVIATPDGGSVTLSGVAAADLTANNFSFDAAPACYCSGTLILTAHGEVAVEDLKVGDLVVTFVGSNAGFKAIRWIGRRRIDLQRRYAKPENVRPIRFRAGALGERRPHRDLVVSPGHRMRVGDELVMALELVNSATIVQESPSEVVYWHIELDQHDMVLAEGVQAETYQDVGNRGAFENGTVVTLDPVLDGDVPEPCLPYAGAQAAVRDRLVACAEVLGWTRQVEPTPWLEVGNHRIEPVCDGNTYRFSLPPGYGSVRLRSRAGRPWDVDPHSGDRRQLGLKLHRLALGSAEGLQEVALDALQSGDGFHPVEQDESGWRWCWTNGDALLSFRRLANVQPITVIEIACDQALPFWVATSATIPAHGSSGGADDELALTTPIRRVV